MSLKNLLIISTASLLWSCVNNNEQNVDDFDIESLLVNAADNIIIPQLKDLHESTVEIENAFSDFEINSNSDNLSKLQSKFKNSYLSWQAASFVNFGNSNFEIFSYTLNTFPVDTQNLVSIFSKPDANLESSIYFNAISYPGFDFAFFQGNEDEIIKRISIDGKNYCKKNIDLIKSKSESAYLFWKNNTDGYYNEFKSDLSKTDGSPFSAYVNAFCKDLEVLKNEQLKAPGGQEFFIFPLPYESEALYSGYSLDLIKAHIDNLERIYKGDDLSGNAGIGFDDYLKSLETKTDGKDLNELILSTFSTIKEKANLLNETLNYAAANQKEIVDELYANVKLLVGYTKTDMTYAFGINISYADPQDGD